MRLTILWLVLLLPIPSWAKPCEKISDLGALIGIWQNVQQKRIIQEQWHQVSDNTFEGSGETYTDQWQHNESLRLLSMPEGIFYLAKVAHNPLPIAFKLTHCDGKSVVFENLEHDFPNKIEYIFMDKQHLTVAVSGQNNKGFTIEFTRLTKPNKKAH